MFVETIIALIILAALAGWAANEILRAGPLEDENHALRLRQAERQWADEEEARNLARYRKHLGTPYIKPTAGLPPELAAAIHDVVDDHNGSRKAPELRVVS